MVASYSYMNDRGRGSTTLVRLVHVRISVLVTLNKTRHFSRIRPENYYCNNANVTDQTQPTDTLLYYESTYSFLKLNLAESPDLDKFFVKLIDLNNTLRTSLVFFVPQ